MSTHMLETDKPISECDDCPCMDEGYCCAAADLRALDFDTDEGFGSRPEWCPLVEPCFVKKRFMSYENGPVDVLISGEFIFNSLDDAKEAILNLRRNHDDRPNFVVECDLAAGLGTIYKEE